MRRTRSQKRADRRARRAWRERKAAIIAEKGVEILEDASEFGYEMTMRFLYGGGGILSLWDEAIASTIWRKSPLMEMLERASTSDLEHIQVEILG